jgi:hypothetical protein
MTKITSLVGLYKLEKNYLLSTDKSINRKLLMTSRINIGAKKPINFLLDKTNPKGSYISSLFWVSDNTGIDTYNFDYKSVKYILTIDKDNQIAEIKQ